MGEHTSSPWTLETVRTSVGLCHKIGPFPSRGSRPQTYACVYVDGLGLRPEDSPELLANARLIAAAPDLLDACRLAVNAIGDTRDELGLKMELEKAYLALRATIAKAEVQ